MTPSYPKLFKILIGILMLVGIFSCGISKKGYQPTRLKTGHYILMPAATDSLYGYHPDFPIQLGGFKKGQGKKNIDNFLLSIQSTTPNHPFFYQRIGGCCEFRHKDGFAEIAYLDVYKLVFSKNQETVQLFFDTYTLDSLKIPVGFKTL